MQQPIYQDQQGGQQGAAQQQMLLCPVRLVYETQILVQPGEQIQPNQTIFINPHNPPPWIQNRPQNNVMYVQQMAPNNFMQQIQQHPAQNPIYIHQNYNNIQQMIPQQIISQAQHKEVRTTNVQMTNMLQRNPPQSLQPTPGPYNTAPSEPTQNTATANYGVIPANYMQNQITQNQINFIPTNVNNKQIIQNVQTPPRPAVTTTNVMNFQRNIEMQQNIPRPVQQTFQHESNMIQTSLPQSITMVPIQPTQPLQRPNDTQDQITQIRPMQTLVANKPTLPPTSSTISNSTHERIVKKIAAVSPKGNITVNTLVNTAPKNVPSYSYRPIQPRPQQQRNIASNLTPNNTQTQIKGPPKLQQPLPYNANPLTYVMTSNYTNTEQSMFNRKRKSESPDEVQKKMMINHIPQKNSPVAVVSSVQTNTVSSIGVNTMPMQKTHKMPPNISRMPTMIRNEETIKDIQRMEVQTVKETSQSETEKLLRNTVFTQARNRVLSDKQEIISTNVVKVETITSDIKSESILKKELEKEPAKNMEESKKELVKNEEENKIELINKEEENKKDLVKKEEEIRKDLEEESKKVLVKKEENKIELIKKEEENKEATKNEDSDPVFVQAKEEKIGKDANDVVKPNIREINVLGNSKSNDKNGFVLTHVLDGYVIQESNIAFPIRRPLKEKPLPPNTVTEVKKDTKVKPENSTKIFNLSNLNLNDAEEKKKLAEEEENKDCKESVSKKDNPFAALKTETVKSWTVKELTEHLVKYEWEETVSVLLEHEIDGESLYLVSKNQLVSIGISEEHADIICDFVKR
ncbi:PREDICTED: reticulocyte-binding protein 2 homolog a-like [Papilio xuthus]|uniref:Reticulocyte-binding protein 2 homolog a-like n=1 Tax=Papilio xuthus TaxID=66420 RepID=A0AAJ6ZMA1_PAPXU|nr:PREDICTED: reticulocyte-binding protein 2 homolog a-like [Papilio xuthus]